jgi:hypothetical protein
MMHVWGRAPAPGWRQGLEVGDPLWFSQRCTAQRSEAARELLQGGPGTPPPPAGSFANAHLP